MNYKFVIYSNWLPNVLIFPLFRHAHLQQRICECHGTKSGPRTDPPKIVTGSQASLLARACLPLFAPPLLHGPPGTFTEYLRRSSSLDIATWRLSCQLTFDTTWLLNLTPSPSRFIRHLHLAPIFGTFSEHLYLGPSPNISIWHLHLTPPFTTFTCHLHSTPSTNTSIWHLHLTPPFDTFTYHLHLPSSPITSICHLHLSPPFPTFTYHHHLPPSPITSICHLHLSPPFATFTYHLHLPPSHDTVRRHLAHFVSQAVHTYR